MLFWTPVTFILWTKTVKMFIKTFVKSHTGLEQHYGG